MPSAIRRSSLVKSRDQLAAMLNEKGLIGEAVEIGVHLGEFAERFLSRWGGSQMTLVDPWANLPGYRDRIATRDRQADYEACMARIAGVRSTARVNVLRETSREAVERFRDSQLDFVYVDGDHSPESVMFDVSAWWPKIAPGGVLAGHDWFNEWRPGVEAAVRSVADGPGLTIWTIPDNDNAGSWFIWKPLSN